MGISKIFQRLIYTIAFLSIASLSYAGWYGPRAIDNPCAHWKESVSIPKDSTLFDPMISVTEDWCFGWFGYKDTKTLRPPAENIPDYCMTFDEQGNVVYSDAPECISTNCATIMSRYCARMTAPGEHGNNFSCGGSEEETATTDDGNSEGLEDAIYCSYSDCPECRCTCNTRLCVFNDPMIPIDYGDTMDTKMPFHYMTKGEDIDTYSEVMSVDSYLSLYYNQVVYWTVGCVDIPLGPYPPPFCNPIQASKPVTAVLNICEYSPQYEISNTSTSDDADSNNYKQISTISEPCELATATGNPGDTGLYSTFERPITRLYFTQPIKVCPKDYVPPPEGTSKNDYCLWFDSDLTGKNIWEDKKNLLQVCPANGTTTTDCIKFPSGRIEGPLGSSTSYGQDYTYFKPYYSISGAQGVDPGAESPYAEYDDPAVTVSLGGVYDSYYENMRDNYTKEIIDFMGFTRKFNSYINIVDDDDPTTEDDGTYFYVYEIMDTADTSPVPVTTTKKRPKMFPPVVYPCLANNSCYYTSSSVMENEPRISYEVGRTFTDIDGTVVKPKKGVIAISKPDDDLLKPFCVLDDNNPGGDGQLDGDAAPCTVYSAKVFSAYLTDDVNYLLSADYDTDGSGPDTKGTTHHTGTYNGGMQYVNAVYCRGATKICLSGYDNENKEVVTKSILNPETGKKEASNTLTDRVIPPYVPGENQKLTDDQLYNQNIHLWTSGEETTSKKVVIGYKVDNADGSYTYLESSSCTSGSTSCTANVEIYPTDDITCMCTNSTSAEPYVCPENSLCKWAFEQSYTSSTGTPLGYKYTDSEGTEYYSSSDYAVREVNSMELGLCVEAAQDHCDAISETITSPTAQSNGYASWPQTNAADTGIGTCVDGMVRDEDENGNALDPIRQCQFIDKYEADGVTPILEENGCPVYTLAFGPVTNPCVSLPYPTWWPSQFLALRDIQGAIFNQFNVAYDYQSIFIPKAANYNPMTKEAITNTTSTWVEDWYNTSTYDSCKYYPSLKTKNNTPRNAKDGDQEMLYLTQAQWQNLWNTNDLTWLLEDKPENNGCYVYQLGTKINATFPTSGNTQMKVGMKICKYDTKISFSLVDTYRNTALDCTNNAYIMQSNLITYDQYIGQYADPTGRDSTFTPKTTVVNSLSGRKSNYHHYINHGIVINKNGFEENDYVAEVTKTPPPIVFDEVCANTPEGITASFLFAGQFQYDTGSESDQKYKHYTFNPNEPNASCTGSGKTSYRDLKKPTEAVYGCALAAYRDNSLDYSYTVDISKYLPNPSNINPYGYSGDSDMNNEESYISKMYQYNCYNGSHKDSPWPQQTECAIDVTLKDYVPGNSARNPHMFYWSGNNNYKVCNE